MLRARQSAELDATRARYADVSSRIGFKGDGEFSSHEAIRGLLALGGKTMAAYNQITSEKADQKGEVRGTKQVPLKFTINGKQESINVGQVDVGAKRVDEPIYDNSGSMNLHGAIGAQDFLITQLVGTHNKNVRDQRIKQRQFRDDAATERRTETDKAAAAVNASRESSDTAMKERAVALSGAEAREATARRSEIAAFMALDSADIRARRENAFAKLKDTALARKRAIESQADYRRRADSRRYDDSRDTDGFVFLVDQRSGWLWINIGQQEDVRLNQTFQVVRADAGKSGLIQVAEVRVKEVLQGNVARCRVDALDDPKVYPQSGDMIRNPNFSKRQYRTFALAGQFGGQYSQHTRQELVDMLLRLGFQVTSKIDGATDAVIIGGNWTEDAEYARAKSLQYSFETYTEEDVLYFLGFIGPDARR
jgi:hypothetical protein